VASLRLAGVRCEFRIVPEVVAKLRRKEAMLRIG